MGLVCSVDWKFIVKFSIFLFYFFIFSTDFWKTAFCWFLIVFFLFSSPLTFLYYPLFLIKFSAVGKIDLNFAIHDQRHIQNDPVRCLTEFWIRLWRFFYSSVMKYILLTHFIQLVSQYTLKTRGFLTFQRGLKDTNNMEWVNAFKIIGQS